MTFDQLYAFYAIHKHQTFSQAAYELNITQSALSKQIAKLEQELDIVLFDRTHRQVTLTPAGQQFLKDIQIILQDYEKMINHIRLFKNQTRKTMKIAMFPIFSQYDIAKKITDFTKKYPDIHLVIDEIEERDIHHKLDYHDYDFYILRGNYPQLTSFRQLLLYEDSLICVVSKNHPLSKKSHLDILDLKNENILLPPQYTMIAQTAIHACHQAGFQPHILKYGRLETILASVYENEGIAIMMKKSLHIFHLSQMKVIPFSQDIHSDIFLYYSTQHHRDEISLFIKHIQPNK